MGLRTAAILAIFLVSSAQLAGAQAGSRRVTTIHALRQFPGYYHLQNVTLRGEFGEDGSRLTLRADGQQMRVVLGENARTASGPVEVRGQLIDVGRLDPGDPRVPPRAEARETQRRPEATAPDDPQERGGAVSGERPPWPRPGEELVLRATSVTPAQPSATLTVRALALEPWRYDGQKVTVVGNFRGRNLFGDLPGAPGESRYDFVIRGAEGAVWVTGMQPRGRGFNLDIDRRVDTDAWLEVTGTVAHERGLVRIKATQLAQAKAPAVTDTAEEVEPPPPPPPPLEVVFSSPTPDELEVNAASPVRIQFSRGVNPKSIPGSIRVSYVGFDGPAPEFQTTYDAASRAIALRFTEPLARFRTVKVEVLDTLKAFDGAATRPWTLTFTVGG